MLERFDRVIDASLVSIKKALKSEDEWYRAKMLLAQVVKGDVPEKDLLYQLSAYINAFNISKDQFRFSLVKGSDNWPKRYLRDLFEALGNISQVYFHLTGKESRLVGMLNSIFSEIMDYVLEDKFEVALIKYESKAKHISDMVEVMRFFKEPYRQLFAELRYAYDAVCSKDSSAIEHLAHAKEMLERVVRSLEEF